MQSNVRGTAQKIRIAVAGIGVFHFSVFFVLVLLMVSWIGSFVRFNAWANLVIAAAVAAPAWWFLRPHEKLARNPFANFDRKHVAVLAVVVILVGVLTFAMFHDTFFSTRDEGIYANNAVYLVRHGRLPYPTVEGRESRHFLNTVSYAEGYGIAGFRGMKLANVVPLCLGLLCIFLLVADLSGSAWAGIFAVTIAAFAYPLIWYARRTCTEALFFSVFWIGAYYLYRFTKRRDFLISDFTITLLSFALLAFNRGEGLAVAAIAALAMGYVAVRRLVASRKAVDSILLVVLVLVMAGSLALGWSLFKPYATASVGTSESVEAGDPAVSSEQPLITHKGEYSLLVMLRFGFLPALLLAIPFLFFLLKDRRSRLFGLFLLAVFLVFAYFLFRPNVGYDLPWFLRRFTAVLIPLSIVAFCYVVFRLKEKQAIAVAAVFLAITIFVSQPILFRREYKGMITHVGQVAAMVPDGSRILVDRYAAGDYGMSLALFSVYGKDAVSVVPWVDKLGGDDLGRGSTVYFVTNKNNYGGVVNTSRSLFESPAVVRSGAPVGELRVGYISLNPTAEIHRGTGGPLWPYIDYRVALAKQDVPGTWSEAKYDILVVRLDLVPEADGKGR